MALPPGAYLFVYRFNRISNADAVMISAYWEVLMKTEHMISTQLVNPWAQCTSKGQKKETREAVNKRSAMRWEKITRKQFPNRIFGILKESFRALDARNPINTAKIRL